MSSFSSRMLLTQCLVVIVLELGSLFNSLNSFVFHTDVFRRYNIAKKPNLFLLKLILLQVGIQ